MAIIYGYKELKVFEKAFRLSMVVFELSKGFPKEEKYALTDQLRRSSRAICSNIAEAWAKKIYMKHFVSKLSDSLGEEFETEVWLKFCYECSYINTEVYETLTSEYEEVRKLLIYMMNNSRTFCEKASKRVGSSE